ncbi:MAG: T9SS type A sorting domain-containing protein, partial [Bacteroidota bacterium]
STACSLSTLTPVTITVAALPTLVISASQASVCLGGTLNIGVTGATSYTWSTGSNSASIAPTVTATTNYSVIGINAPGCSSTSSVSITGLAQPTVSVVSSTSLICVGGTASLTASGATSYTWSTGANGASIALTVTATTNYSVIGEIAPGCSSTSSVSITGLANPTVSVVSSTSIICVGGTASLTASGASTYSWNTSSTNTVIAISPTVNTTYTVTGTSSNSCKNIATITQSVSACTGLNNNGASTIGALVYPNPNTGLFTIELNNGSVKNFEVMDVTGRIVLANTTSNDKVDLNINTLANGIYYVKIQSNNSFEVIKIVKQ